MATSKPAPPPPPPPPKRPRMPGHGKQQNPG